MGDQVALCRCPIMFEVSAIAIGASDVVGIDKRVTRGLFVATHNGVAVQLFKGPIFVTAPFALAIADFHRAKGLGCVGFPVFTANRTIQTFTSSDWLTKEVTRI